MITKSYDKDGKLFCVGTDTIEEAFAWKELKELIEEVPSNRFRLKEGAIETIHSHPKFAKWMKEGMK